MSGPVVDHLLVSTAGLDGAAAAAGRLGLPVAGGNRDFLDWIGAETAV